MCSALSESQKKLFPFVKWGSTSAQDPWNSQHLQGCAGQTAAMGLMHPSAAFPPEEGIVVCRHGQELLRQGGKCSVWAILRGFVAPGTTGCAVPLKCLGAASPGVPMGSQQSPVVLRNLHMTSPGISLLPCSLR